MQHVFNYSSTYNVKNFSWFVLQNKFLKICVYVDSHQGAISEEKNLVIDLFAIKTIFVENESYIFNMSSQPKNISFRD